MAEPKYLPTETDITARYDVFSKELVHVTYNRLGKCQHANVTNYRYQDRRPRRMPRFYGTCCCDCGLILERTELK